MAMMAGPVVWAVVFLAAYLFAEAACSEYLLLQEIGGLSALTWVVLALLVAGIAVIAYAAFRAYGVWRVRRNQDLVTEDDTQFMALAAIGLAAIFALTLLLTALAPIFLSPCQWI